jgi:multiple sugar transport system substrate-binding protein
VTITIWHAESGPAAALLGSLANEFHDQFPSITVEAKAKNDEGDLLRVGIAGMAMNQLPDLVIASKRTIGEFARKGAVEPLDPLFGDPSIGLAAADRRDFVPGLLDGGRFSDIDHELYALPFDESAIVLYYNADLLKGAGITTPPSTWDQFNSAALATTKGDVRGWAMWPNAPVLYAFLVSRGSSALDDAETAPQFTDDAGVKSLQLIAALSKGGSAYLVDTPDAALADFVQGKTALYIGTTDDLSVLSDDLTRTAASFQWGVATIPQSDPTHPQTTVYGSDLAILAQDRNHARAAWLFARWLTEPAQTARWASTTLSVPVRLSALPLLAGSATSPLLQRLQAGFGDTLPEGRPVPAVHDAAQIDAAMVEMWAAVANGTDPSAAIADAAAQVNRILAQQPSSSTTTPGP